jgi:DNA repair exonuclease SbcCD ATPase subunit
VQAVAPFGLFKKKDNDSVPAEQPVIVEAGALSILQAQDLLRNVESAKVQELASRLAPVKESASESLREIAELASHMEHEKIKLEDLEQRHKSVIENSRRTVVSSLKREASTEFQLPQSVNDAKKFKEKFEAMMNRIGEVTGSHSKVLNVFMKKHANKMKDEFEALSKLLNEIKSAMSDFDQKRAPIVKCGGILNTASQKVASIKSTEASMQNIESEIKNAEAELEQLKGELGALEGSAEFDQAASVVHRIEEAEGQEEQLREQMVDLFSRVSRAFTKYSYNITKETEARLNVLSEEPWKMLYEADISPYSSLLLEVRKSIDSGKVQLKDSDKVLNYLDVILQSLPELQGRAQALRAETDSLHQSDVKLVHRAKELEEKIAQHDAEMAKNRQLQEQQKRQVAEKTGEVDALLKEAGEILAELTGQKYSLEY